MLTFKRGYVVNAAEVALPAKLSELVNDKHSKLNATLVKGRICPQTTEQLIGLVRAAAAQGDKICIAGGRHAMGGQQFLQNGLLVDTTNLNRVLNFDSALGLIEVQAGMRWPELVTYLRAQSGSSWAIRQKQTGCDSLSIGGALSANIHGRGLGQAPFVSDVEEFKIVTADGELRTCSRTQNSELFSLAIGGYGLFGLIASATLRLAPRRQLRRNVQIVNSDRAVSILEQQAAAGASHGDFQFNIDDSSEEFLQSGILSTYTPLLAETESEDRTEAKQKELSGDDWRELIYLAHCDKEKAYKKYVRHYLTTDGQTYWSDVFQLSTYVEHYHTEIDRLLHSDHIGSELISELYVPRRRMGAFLRNAAPLLRSHNANVIYGTVRLIEQDSETFLPWAKEPWACVVFNLHVDHCEEGLKAAKKSFSALIDLAIHFGGSYYLTYHRFADSKQLKACYPTMPDFLRLKDKYDPNWLFASDWYRHIPGQAQQ